MSEIWNTTREKVKRIVVLAVYTITPLNIKLIWVGTGTINLNNEMYLQLVKNDWI